MQGRTLKCIPTASHADMRQYSYRINNSMDDEHTTGVVYTADPTRAKEAER